MKKLTLDQKLTLRQITLMNLTVLSNVSGGRDLTRFTGCDQK